MGSSRIPPLLLAVAALAGTTVLAGDEPRREGEPLFSFAWISDLHLDGSRLDLARTAFRHIDERLHPLFVLFTGDDCAIAAPPVDPEHPEPADLRRQRFLKGFLAENLRSPAVLLPGDNWPGGFDEVFGNPRRSFEIGGLHFLLLAPDRTFKAPRTEGLSAFDPPTREWIRSDLEASRGKPAIIAIHEPLYPPSFLDAMPLRRLVAAHDGAIAVLQGHLHVELEYRADGKTYLVAPALGPGRRPAMEQVLVYPDRLVFQVFARDPATGAFERGRGRRIVGIPQELRSGLRRPAGGFVPENVSTGPSGPLLEDPALAERKVELLENIGGFLIRDVRPAPGAPRG